MISAGCRKQEHSHALCRSYLLGNWRGLWGPLCVSYCLGSRDASSHKLKSAHMRSCCFIIFSVLVCCCSTGLRGFFQDRSELMGGLQVHLHCRDGTTKVSFCLCLSSVFIYAANAIAALPGPPSYSISSAAFRGHCHCILLLVA